MVFVCTISLPCQWKMFWICGRTKQSKNHRWSERNKIEGQMEKALPSSGPDLETDTHNALLPCALLLHITVCSQSRITLITSFSSNPTHCLGTKKAFLWTLVLFSPLEAWVSPHTPVPLRGQRGVISLVNPPGPGPHANPLMTAN